MIPVSIVVYWMMILWLKQSDMEIKQSDTCVNSGLLNDDILIKTKLFWLNINVSMEIENKVIPVSMVVYWMMIFLLKEGDTCVNAGLLNDDTLIKTKWYLCQWWFIEWWHFD